MKIGPLTAAAIAQATGGELVHGDGAVRVTGAALDHRRVKAGDMFVAVVGERVDGHTFARAAAAAGAACLLIRRDRWPLPATGPAPALPPDTAVIAVADPVAAVGELGRQHRNALPGLTVVGVTGSTGKTSTKDMVAAVLSQGGPVLKNPGNLNSEFTLPLVLLQLQPDHRYAVLEMGMRARGDIAGLCRIAAPEIAVVTNVGISHLELLGSQEQIALAKAEIVAALPPGGCAVLPADDPWFDVLKSHSTAPVLAYGLGPGAAVTAQAIELAGLDGTAFELCLPDGTVPVRLPVPGRHQVLNALAAAAVGHAAGLSPAEIAAGLAQLEPSGQRTAVHRCGGVTVIDDTYNASPASVAAALDLLAGAVARGRGQGEPQRTSGRGRAVAVLGDMYELGAETEAGHRDTGAYAAQAGVGLLVAVGALGRLIGDGAVAAGMAPDRVMYAADNGAAVALLRERLEPGDTVLVKGSRGMRMEEIVAALCTGAVTGG